MDFHPIPMLLSKPPWRRSSVDGFYFPVLCCGGAFIASMAPVVAWNREDKTVIVVWFTSFIAIIVFIFILLPLMLLLGELLNDQMGFWSFLILLSVSTAIVTAIVKALGKLFK